MTRKIRRTAGASAAVAACLMALTSPAFAFGSGGPTPPAGGPNPAPVSNPGTPSDTGGTVSRGIGKCHVVSSPSYLGVSCGDVTGGGKTTIKDILGKDPLPGCWNERMTDREKEALNLQDTPGPDGYTYWWRKCLSGIDKKTLKVEPGGVQITWGWQAIPNTKGKVVVLTKNQQKLIQFKASQGMIPTPLAAIAPTGSPVVNQQVAFFDGTDHEVQLSEGGLQLQAKVTKLVVHPSDDGTSASCPGAGVNVGAHDSRASQPNACWYHFRKSSADQPDQRFAGSITASWEVRYSTDNGKTWQPLNKFDKNGLSSQQVNEIQALNVN